MEEKTGIPARYDPADVEKKWYDAWESAGCFHQEADPEREPFCIVMPPPNVTGQLHLGHAMDNTLQDILVRWRRMQGYNTLWVPGTDHAGIATQARVEENLAAEGIKREELGRDAFLERVWAWKETYHERIAGQLRLLGSSCDWQRERFTMDEGCSRAVREVFVRLYEKDLIYRGHYMVNWCTRCHTTISDIEVEHEEEGGHLWHIRYPVEGGTDEIVIATTRPETMLGDTAVAVHPGDERYVRFHGKQIRLPIAGRTIPLITDEYVDPAFGSGALKITPAHDPNDFEVARRHDLPHVVVIDEEGRMTGEAGVYAGMDRFECRQALLAELEAQGLLVRTEPHVHSVGHCYRCQSTIEPLVSNQWFVRMAPLADPAMEAVRKGDTRFVPARFTKVYLAWMENIRDWCISRQLWWGHRIPVWYCQECGEVLCVREDPAECPACGGTRLEQDPDVLDTWFSSALWPFETLGWPEQTRDLAHFYPTSVLVTGRDIIFFWVARMIFTGLEFMEEVPFREVFIHGLILDARGRKMSKSLGNGIDPLDVIREYGADTLRFMLVTGNTPGNDLRFQPDRLQGVRNFTNKIWNAARFSLMNLAGTPGEVPARMELSLADRWILSEYNETVRRVERALERYELGEAAQAIYEFTWNSFCDWYIEMAKPSLYGKRGPERQQSTRYVLARTLSGILCLLHPFMPFLTEEIWQQLRPGEGFLMLASWPRYQEDLADPAAQRQMGILMDVTRVIRNLRAEMNVEASRRIPVVLDTENDDLKALLQAHTDLFPLLAGASEVVFAAGDSGEEAARGISGEIRVRLPLAGMIDMDQERARLEKDLEKLDGEVARIETKLGNPGFREKAPPAIVERETEKLQEYRTQRETIRENLDRLGGVR